MPTKPLKRSTLIAFGLPAAPIAGLGLPLVVHLPPFYAADLGLGLSTVGWVFMLTRFWDVVTDPVLGVLSDRFSTRWGRRRHWLVISVPVLVVSVTMLFMPRQPVSAAHLLFWLIVLYVGWTLLTLSHMSWGAELSNDYHERSRVQGWREIFLIGGMIAVLTLPAAIESFDPNSLAATRVAAMGWFIVILLPLTVAFAVTTVGERRAPPPGHTSWGRALETVAQNQPLRRILLLDLISGFGGGIVASLFLFMAEDWLRLGRSANALLLFYFAVGFVFVPIMIRVSYRFGKHRTLAGSALFSAATLPLLLVIPKGNLLAALGVFFLFGINMGVGPFLFRSMMADVADHDRVKDGEQRTGLYFSLLTMTNKVGQALSIGVIYPLLGWLGYARGAVNAPEAVGHLVDMFVWPPLLISATVAVLIWNFPLGVERQEVLRRVIEQREAPAVATPERRVS
jgi:glycoside/pentoside/hexuronide:cation symporter, GPH family